MRQPMDGFGTASFADLILAGIIFAGWPASVAWALGLLVGINLFMWAWR